jgi:hypothetical protein
MEYLYGINAPTLEVSHAEIVSLTHLEFKLHESSFRAGDYYLHKGDKFKEVIIQKNFDEMNDEWFEDEFKEYPFIIYWNFSSPESAVTITQILRASKIIAFLKKK